MGHGLVRDEYRSAKMVAAVVAIGAVVVAAAATAATVVVIAETVVLAAAAAGSVAGTVVETAVERTAGKSTEARLRTWYEDSERPWGSKGEKGLGD
jgi:hypothetical protein